MERDQKPDVVNCVVRYDENYNLYVRSSSNSAFIGKRLTITCDDKDNDEPIISSQWVEDKFYEALRNVDHSSEYEEDDRVDPRDRSGLALNSLLRKRTRKELEIPELDGN